MKSCADRKSARAALKGLGHVNRGVDLVSLNKGDPSGGDDGDIASGMAELSLESRQ